MEFTKRDWEEDFKYENGFYQNKCFKCKQLFFGYKRRLYCKICGTERFVALKRLLCRHQTTITTLPHPGFYEGCVIKSTNNNLMKVIKVIDNHTITVKKMTWIEIGIHYTLMFFIKLFRKAENLLCRWSA